MEFEIKRVITNEYKDELLNIDLNDLEQFISDGLINSDFGDAVIKYFWGFELFKFDGNFAEFFKNDVESWKHSTKWLVTNSHFDWNVVKSLDNESCLALIKIEIIKSIDRIKEMKRKPKNFDYSAFKDKVENILQDYKRK
jgi:hypothetical protein